MRWFVADDDTIFIVENSVRVLAKYGCTQFYYIALGVHLSAIAKNQNIIFFSYAMAYGGVDLLLLIRRLWNWRRCNTDASSGFWLCTAVMIGFKLACLSLGCHSLKEVGFHRVMVLIRLNFIKKCLGTDYSCVYPLRSGSRDACNNNIIGKGGYTRSI